MVTFILLVIFSSQDFILAAYSGKKMRTRRKEWFIQLKGSVYDRLLRTLGSTPGDPTSE